jgi:hypothetical protein
MLLVGHRGFVAASVPKVSRAIVATCHNSLAPPQSGHYSARRSPPPCGFRASPGEQPRRALSYSLFKDTDTLRKIILAAAIAGAALSLTACSEKTEDATSEAADSAAADAAANADAAATAVTDATTDAAAATSEAVDGSTTTETTTATTTAQ